MHNLKILPIQFPKTHPWLVAGRGLMALLSSKIWKTISRSSSMPPWMSTSIASKTPSRRSVVLTLRYSARYSFCILDLFDNQAFLALYTSHRRCLGCQRLSQSVPLKQKKLKSRALCLFRPVSRSRMPWLMAACLPSVACVPSCGA